MISIKDRFKPYFQGAHETCMVPKSPWTLEAFPQEFIFKHGDKSHVLKLNLQETTEFFQLEQDLEKDLIKIYSQSKSGYFQFEIFHKDQFIHVVFKRGKEISIEFQGKELILKKGDLVSFEAGPSFSTDHIERLSFGMNKKMDWQLVKKRNDLKEILPILFFLGQKIEPSLNPEGLIHPSDVVQFKHFLRSYFHHMLVPRRGSDRREGIFSELLPANFPLEKLLRFGYESIRLWLIQEDEAEISLLKSLPKEFVSGRVTGLKTRLASFDIEWNKGKIFKVKVTGLKDGLLNLSWPKYVDSFRLRHNLKERGRFISLDQEIVISPQKVYYLDKFQK
jgi:hypothetical protein